jgi:prepilin-type N-terminal cleavage/methylation domain-containing protein
MEKRIMKNEKGFSLVELLVVVIIIAIIAAIAIPNLLASRRAANEASAIQSMRTIHSGQATYQALFGGNVNYAPALGNLSGAGVDLIDDQLGSGGKSGYLFVSTGGSNVYCASAAPDSAASGTRGFAVSEQGVVYEYATGVLATGACGGATFTQGSGVAVGGGATAPAPSGP